MSKKDLKNNNNNNLANNNLIWLKNNTYIFDQDIRVYFYKNEYSYNNLVNFNTNLIRHIFNTQQKKEKKICFCFKLYYVLSYNFELCDFLLCMILTCNMSKAFIVELEC